MRIFKLSSWASSIIFIAIITFYLVDVYRRWPDKAYPISAVVISPSLNRQESPAINGSKIIWSEYIQGYWQIILFDAKEQTRKQLTTNAQDHVHPSISGDVVVWWEGDSGGADYAAGINYVTGETISFPKERIACPRIAGKRVVWLGGFDLNTFLSPVISYDIETQKQVVIGYEKLPGCPRLSGDILVLRATRSDNKPRIYAYDLSTNQSFLVYNDFSEEQDWPDISGDIVVWESSTKGIYSNPQHIFAYNIKTKEKLFTSKDTGSRPRISGDLVVWGSGVYAYDLNTKTTYKYKDDYRNYEPIVDGNFLVWTRENNTYDPRPHTQIVIGKISSAP